MNKKEKDEKLGQLIYDLEKFHQEEQQRTPVALVFGLALVIVVVVVFVIAHGF
jgi:hypothetical protein